MKRNITCFLLAALFIMIFPLLFAQQDQITPKSNPEVEALKNRISVLESKLQTVENIEKMELAAKLADANAKLANAEFSKFERELRDSNNKWLWGWTGFFVGVFAVIGIALWLVVKSLIGDRVEKSLNGFKETVGQVNILQSQIRILEKEHAASVLEDYMELYDSGSPYTQQIEELSEQTLLDVFGDETRYLALRCRAAEVLSNKKSKRLIFPGLKCLNSIVDSDDLNWEQDFIPQYNMRDLVNFLGYVGTPEAYEGLAKFLDRLLTENPENKGLVLTPTAFRLANISSELNKRDSIAILKRAIPFFRVLSDEDHDLKNLAEYFDRSNEQEGVKEILTNDLTDRMPEVETRCLELLQKHDPDFVEKWKAEKETANTQNKESE